jgi:hypothetical protein
MHSPDERSTVRATTRSIIVSLTSVVLVVTGGISVALSRTGSSALPLDCLAEVHGLASATRTGVPVSAPPTNDPSQAPTSTPTSWPTSWPTSSPTCPPTGDPSHEPTLEPTSWPTSLPTSSPSSTPKPPDIPVPKCSEPPTVKEVEDLLKGWIIALKHDSQKVADRYDEEESILLSTLKPEVFKKREKIKTYFDTFLLLKPTAEVGDRQISIIGTKGAVDTGLYKFTFDDGKTDPIEARYSFTYKVVDEKCVILSHHSSALPKKK